MFVLSPSNKVMDLIHRVLADSVHAVDPDAPSNLDGQPTQ